jgi:hypothetical protein
MTIEFSDLAIDSWLQDLDYTLSKFGRKTAAKNEAAMEERLNFVRKYPEAGHIELVRAKKTYRSFQIRNTPLKIIYSITERDDKIIIEDFWNSYQSREHLVGRIK